MAMAKGIAAVVSGLVDSVTGLINNVPPVAAQYGLQAAFSGARKTNQAPRCA